MQNVHALLLVSLVAPLAGAQGPRHPALPAPRQAVPAAPAAPVAAESFDASARAAGIRQAVLEAEARRRAANERPAGRH